MTRDPLKPTAEELLQHERWIEECPPDVQVTARRWHPFTCYRDAGNLQHTHYMIVSYALLPADAGPYVKVSVLHGADSALPSVRAFGIDPRTLAVCGCGEWQLPTAEQVKLMDRHFDCLERARALAPKKPATDPSGNKPTTKH
jgi:hypothetical protein